MFKLKSVFVSFTLPFLTQTQKKKKNKSRKSIQPKTHRITSQEKKKETYLSCIFQLESDPFG